MSGRARTATWSSSRRGLVRSLLTLLTIGALCATAAPLRAKPSAAAEPAGLVVPSVFHIEKSENRNQVHYAVRIDERCRPLGKQPVYGYWRDLEVGPRATSPLLNHEQSAYGLTEPRYVKQFDRGGEIRLGLRGFPDRPLTIETFTTDGRCRARARTPINGQNAILLSIYVKLGFLFSVEYVVLRGTRLDGTPLQEKVHD